MLIKWRRLWFENQHSEHYWGERPNMLAKVVENWSDRLIFVTLSCSGQISEVGNKKFISVRNKHQTHILYTYTYIVLTIKFDVSGVQCFWKFLPGLAYALTKTYFYTRVTRTVHNNVNDKSRAHVKNHCIKYFNCRLMQLRVVLPP